MEFRASELLKAIIYIQSMLFYITPTTNQYTMPLFLFGFANMCIPGAVEVAIQACLCNEKHEPLSQSVLHVMPILYIYQTIPVWLMDK